MRIKPQAVIFDMDGVLIDSELWWPQVEDEFYSKLFPAWKKTHLQHLVGKGARDIHTYLQKKFNCSLTYDAYLKMYHQMAGRVYENVQLMPNAQKLLNTLQKSQLQIALASSATRQIINTILDRFNLHSFFAATVSAEDVNMRGKPAPDIYLHVTKQLNVTPKHAIAIEDSAHGITSAKAAGMYSVAYKTPYNKNQKLDSADAVITDLLQILTLFSR